VSTKEKAWCQLIAGGDEDLFWRRQAWDGFETSSIRRALGPVRLINDRPLPEWANAIADLISHTDSYAGGETEGAAQWRARLLDPAVPVAFEEILLPMISQAVRRVKRRVGTVYHLLSEKAHACLERDLLEQLSQLCGQTLYFEFWIHQTASVANNRLRGSGANHQHSEDSARYYYDGFVECLLADGYRRFFHRYCVLARLVGTLLTQWVEATSEFLHRLARDRPAIQTTFSDAGDLGQVISVLPGLSDPHEWSRSVMALQFAAGTKIIYKPRWVSLEWAFFEILAWCNEQALQPRFKLIKIIDRSTYGWVEYVEALPCRRAEEAGRYFERAGMLLCLLYILEGADFHAGNIIACGEHPVLIDLEALMHPRLVEEEGRDHTHPQEANSVLRTGLLPGRADEVNEADYYATGLAGVAGEAMSIQGITWKNVNTDMMALVYEPQKTRTPVNLPVLDDCALSSSDYTDEIVAGFETMYRFLKEKRGSVVAPDGPVSTLAHQPVRFIFRATSIYQSILLRTQHPSVLRDGADQSIQLDMLSKPLLKGPAKHLLWPLLQEERQALERLDIPRFVACSDDDGLSTNAGGRIEHCFIKPSYNLVLDRLNQLCDEDLDRQLSLIRDSLSSRSADKT
ncbi:MAG: type 2 lanthipeptide synthetase LanM, partial [Candidatus Binatia bacterium]